MSSFIKHVFTMTIISLFISSCSNMTDAKDGKYLNSGVNSSTTINTNQTGVDTDGFYYSFWKQDDTGTVSMTLNADGNYTTKWTNCSNFTAGKGWEKGSETRIVNYSGSFDPGNNGYLALYGWMDMNGWAESPVVEYYIVESYGSWVPPGSGADISLLGTMTSDGGTYNIYRSKRINQPWIKDNGKGTFYQYWSVRTSKRSSGTITFSNHLAAWKQAKLTIGSLDVYYQIMETEGYQSSGSSNITLGGNSESTALNSFVHTLSWKGTDVILPVVKWYFSSNAKAPAGYHYEFTFSYFSHSFYNMSDPGSWTTIGTYSFTNFSDAVKTVEYPYYWAAALVKGRVEVNKVKDSDKSSTTIGTFIEKDEFMVMVNSD